MICILSGIVGLVLIAFVATRRLLRVNPDRSGEVSILGVETPT